LFVIAFSILIYLILMIYAGLEQILEALHNFSWPYLFLILSAITAGTLIRFGRWHYYCHVIKIKVNLKDSLIIFLASFGLGIIPAKLGDFSKSYFLKKKNEVPISLSAPIVIVERLTDLLAMVILVFIGSLAFHYSLVLPFFLFLFLTLCLILIRWRKLMLRVIGFFAKKKITAGIAIKLKKIYFSTYQLLNPKSTSLALGSSVIAWFLESCAFYLIFQGLRAPISLLESTFIYSLSTIIGALTFLPGGIGTMEGTMLFLLSSIGINKAQAGCSILIIRLCTFWFGVLLGNTILLLQSGGLMRRKKLYF